MHIRSRLEDVAIPSVVTLASWPVKRRPLPAPMLSSPLSEIDTNQLVAARGIRTFVMDFVRLAFADLFHLFVYERLLRETARLHRARTLTVRFFECLHFADRGLGVCADAPQTLSIMHHRMQKRCTQAVTRLFSILSLSSAGIASAVRGRFASGSSAIAEESTA